MAEILLYAIIVILALMVLISAVLISSFLTKERKPAGWPLAKRFAAAILRGEVPGELSYFAAAGSNCRNCGGKTSRPRWGIGDAHQLLKRGRLAKALTGQKLCLVCLTALAQLRRSSPPTTAPIPVPAPVLASPLGEKDGGEKRNPSAWLRFPVKGMMAMAFAITSIFSANAFVSALAMPKLYLEEWGVFAIFYSFGLAMGGFILGVAALLLLRQLAK